MSHCQCVVTLLLGCGLAHAQAIEAKLEVESNSIRLSETTTATLTVIGPKPLLVRLPTELPCRRSDAELERCTDRQNQHRAIGRWPGTLAIALSR